MRRGKLLIISVGAILAIGMGIGVQQAAAAETAAEGLNAAPAMAAPAQAFTSAPAPRGGFREEGLPRKNELEINWCIALPNPTYSENDQTYSLSGTGFQIDVNPGIKVVTAPGLDVGIDVGFVYVPSSGSFSASYEGPPDYTRNWTVNAISVGAFALAKYNYDLDLDLLKIGIENGGGLGYFLNHVSYDWVDAADDSVSGSGSDDENGWLPLMRVGIKVAMPVTAVSSLGLSLAGLLGPAEAGEYGNFVTISVGLNYQVEY